jgi:hypothetical protein
MADGSVPFDESSCALWSKMYEQLSLQEIQKLPPRERLAVGFYIAACRCRDSMNEGEN